MTGRRRWPRALLVALVVAGGLGVAAWQVRDRTPDVDTVAVARGDFTDTLEIRGEVRPLRSTYVMAPRSAGQLVILSLARDGSAVKAGEVVAAFDAVTLKRTIQDHQSELRTARAQWNQGQAQARIKDREMEAAVTKATYDVERAQAKLALDDVEIVSPVQTQQARLELADAQQRLREAELVLAATRAAAAADRVTLDQRIAKVEADLAQAERAAGALEVRAPIDGTVHIMRNSRASSLFGRNAREYRTGDEAYAGATILELPDLSRVYLVARIDEIDRGQLDLGHGAAIRVDAIPDRQYDASVTQISLLARVDYTSGWPPSKEFDLEISFDEPDERLRPGMSAVARIDVGTLPDVLLVPAGALTVRDGQTQVIRVSRRGFEYVPVEVLRRGRDQAAIAGDLAAGDALVGAPDDVLPESGGQS